jgi:hypothetical protein
MKKVYYCEYCNKKFENESNCSLHEEMCNTQNIPIKVIVLTYDDIIEICEYPTAKIRNDEIKFVDPSYHFNFIKLRHFNLDHVRKLEDGDYCIYTTNFTESYETDCIQRLIETKRKKYDEILNNITKQLESLTNLEKNPVINRDTNCSQAVETIQIDGMQ